MRLARHYVYRHLRADSGGVFYVGKGCHKRHRPTLFERAHARDGRNAAWQSVVVAAGGFVVEIVACFDTALAALTKEREFIALYGRRPHGPLVNQTEGGQGLGGYRFSLKARQAQSERIRGTKHPNWGHRLSAETCRRKSEAIQGARHFLYGKRLPDAWRAAIAAGKLGARNPWFGKPTPVAKRVVDTTTGTIYPSIVCAATAVGIGAKALYQYLDGTRRNRTSLRVVS